MIKLNLRSTWLFAINICDTITYGVINLVRGANPISLETLMLITALTLQSGSTFNVSLAPGTQVPDFNFIHTGDIITVIL